MVFTFQSPGISPALWEQTDDNNPALCPTLHNRKSQQGRCPNVTRVIFYVRREVGLTKMAKVNAYIMHIFEKIELLSIHAT